MASRASGVLERAAFSPGAGGDILPIDENRPAERRRELTTEPFIVNRSGAKLMVEVREARGPKLSRVGERPDDARERHRIGAAGDRDHDARIGSDEVVAADGAPDALD